jgi:L-ascorbate metabolism protein UlaG (beta-lactamase superfamily)
VGCSAYAPRHMWSCMHASPADAVRIFKDVRAKRALGMHWGVSHALPAALALTPAQARGCSRRSP